VESQRGSFRINEDGEAGQLVSYEVTAPDAFDAGPLPLAFATTTVQAYLLPAVRPVAVSGLAVPDFARVTPPLPETHEAV
jgi:hypothetical protein